LITLEKVRLRAEADARTNGCYLNPDSAFLNDLFEGLKQNEERYGYPSCPCRLATGKLELDRDIICPCDYRDPDVKEYGCCYCALYVSKDVFEGKTTMQPIPERRPKKKLERAYGVGGLGAAPSTTLSQTKAEASGESPQIKLKMWYCKQCGYVCYREEPPYICPICKAKKEMFAELQVQVDAQG
jgi:ferredoxin-thioredoxin reductase catalytic chain